MEIDDNPFDAIISSFSNVSLYLENTSDLELMEAKNQTRNDTKTAENITCDFSNSVSDISYTSSKILEGENLMKTLWESLPKNDSIILSHNLQADTVNSIKQIYNVNSPFINSLIKKDLWDEKSKSLCALIQKETVREISEVNNIKDCALYDAEYLKIKIH